MAESEEELKSLLMKVKEESGNVDLKLTFILLALGLVVAFFLGWRQRRAIEERRRANQLQKALDQAAIADRIKTVFIQNMRHEIRTPLNAIMGFAQLMSTTSPTKNAPSTTDTFRRATTSFSPPSTASSTSATWRSAPSTSSLMR